MKSIFRAFTHHAAILAYTLAFWPVAAALAVILGQPAPTPEELAFRRFRWRAGEGGNG